MDLFFKSDLASTLDLERTEDSNNLISPPTTAGNDDLEMVTNVEGSVQPTEAYESTLIVSPATAKIKRSRLLTMLDKTFKPSFD